MNQKERIEARFKERQRDRIEAREKDRNENSKQFHPDHPDNQ